MLRIRFILLGTAAIVFVGAFASASASAHEFVSEKCEEKPSGTLTKYATETECVKNEKPGSGKWQHIETRSEVTGSSSETAELVGAITTSKTKVAIVCHSTEIEAGTGFVELEGKSKATIVYSGCEAFNPETGKPFANCTVPAITAKVNDILEGSPLEDKFAPAVGTEFTSIEIKGATCGVKIGKEPVEGSQKCKLENAGTFAVEHTVECTPSGSNLTYDSNPATYKGKIKIRLASGTKWAAL
jgi:hypothetical protein